MELITEADFKNKRAGSAIFQFSANWCGPCKVVAPHFAKLAKDIATEYPFVIFAKEDAGLEIDGAPEIRGVPCFHFYVNGNLVKDATCTGGSIEPVKEKLMNIIK